MFVKHDLYAIIDKALYEDDSILKVVICCIDAGVKLFQYREKGINKKKSFQIIKKIRKITKENNCTFIINDYLDLVLATGADGLHIGQDDLPFSIARSILTKEKIIGVSTHNIEEAIIAENEGADYIGIGPIFETKSKTTISPVGVNVITDIKKKVNIPVYAIGGINKNNLNEVIESGADGIAVISAIKENNNNPANINHMISQIRKIKAQT